MSKRQDNFEKDMKEAESLLKALEDLQVKKSEA